MKDELDKLLCERYPEIFKNRNGNPRETAMCWGFECGDGWFWLIDALCSQLVKDLRYMQNQIGYCEYFLTQPLTDILQKSFSTPERLEKLKNDLIETLPMIPVATQVKEKFGTLRFYVESATEECMTIINIFEHLSSRVCEVCGTMQDVKLTSVNNWSMTRCPQHIPGEGTKYE
jgi:hypothetical protein